MNNYLAKAINKLKPNSEYTIQNNDYSTIDWIVLYGDAPTQAEINAAIEQLKIDEVREAETQKAQRQAILDRLGLTADEAKLLLG